MRGTILVTGAQGFVGRYLICELIRGDWPAVIGVGRSAAFEREFTHSVARDGVTQPAPLTPDLLRAAMSPRFQYRRADVTGAGALTDVLAEFAPHTIIHLAATRREESAQSLIQGNVQGIRSLVEAAAGSRSVRRIVFGSTCGVYGQPLELPITETAPCVPCDPYAASKLAAEHMGRVLCEKAGIEFVAGRIFNVVGPGQDERHVCGRLASEIAAIAAGRRPPHITVRNIDHTRDYVDVRDVASALATLSRAGGPGVYNIGSGVETSVGNILATLAAESGLANRVEIRRAEDSVGIARHVAGIERLRAIGLVNRFDLKSSLRDVLDYYVGPKSGAARRNMPNEVFHTLA